MGDDLILSTTSKYNIWGASRYLQEIGHGSIQHYQHVSLCVSMISSYGREPIVL